MIEVSVGNEVLRTVKGKFESGAEASEFVDLLIKEGYDLNEIYLYFTNTGILKTEKEILESLGLK